MADTRTKLENLLDTVADTLASQVKDPACPAANLAAAIKLLKDNGIQARATKGSPLGNLAASLPTFPSDDESDELPQH